VKLYLNDWKKIIKTFGFAALLAFFVTVVENGFQHEKYGITKSLYFALSCAVFFVGCSNAITEVCKERNLIKREYMTTLSLGAYISAKTALLLILCAINSLIFASVFAARVGMTEAELLFAPFLEILLTIFLTGLAGSAIGMFVSCLSKNEDAASKLAPILILPQILFSGVIFELGDGFVKHISYIVTARWAMEAFGSFVNLNDLSEKLNSNADFMFEFTQEHAAWSLFKLALFPLVFCSLSFFALKNIRNSKE
jgi:ABC-type multidrug transport system permease subunit